MEKQNPLKTKSFFAVLSLFIISFLLYHYYPEKSEVTEKDTTEVNSERSNIQKIELKIKGMTCAGCDEYIEYVIKEVNGVSSVSVDKVNATAVVVYDKSLTSDHEIADAVNSDRYGVVDIKSIPD